MHERDVRGRHLRPDRAERRGKTTFFNVLSGFVRPVSGTVRAFGEDLLSMVHFRRARWGVRRTFQTEQAIEELSVFDNVAMVTSTPG
jgi:ABC-type branched-subunit amino acid transport system ATPase component